MDTNNTNDYFIEYTPKPESITNKSDWLELRKTKITGSDMPLIMEYLVSAKTKYFERSIYDFTRSKLYPNNNISNFQKEMFSRGLLEEALLVSQAVEDFGKENVFNNRYYIRDAFMATLDIEVIDNENKYSVYEVKTTSSRDSYDSYKLGTHPSYWQVCMQLYCLEGLTNSIDVIIKPTGKIESMPIVKITISSSGDKYKLFLKNISLFRNIQQKVCMKQEYYIENTNGDNTPVIVGPKDIEPLYDPILAETADEYINTCNSISLLEIKRNELRDSIINSEKINGHSKIMSSSEFRYLSIRDRNTKSMKDDYKDKYNSIKAYHKKILDKEIALNFGMEAYNISRSKYIVVGLEV